MDLNVLIIGGGIHGVGVLHDLASRRISGVHLVERARLASGTSSKSTKLVHGGVRYLEHLGQWPLVYEALHERTLLLKILKDIVKPVPLVVPVFKGERPLWLVRTGLFLYDLLSGDGGLPGASKLTNQQIASLVPYLKHDILAQSMQGAFLYYDAQMLDDVVVRIVAHAAQKCGASFEEKTEVTSVVKIEGGYLVTLKDSLGNSRTVSTKYIVNATGPWCSWNLLKWGFIPKVTCLLNVGSHIVLNAAAIKERSPESCAATLIQEHDGRVVFFIPWQGGWLLGTTESILQGELGELKVPEADKKYLMDTARGIFNLENPEQNIRETFCGVRCQPLDKKERIAKFQESWRTNPFESPFYVRHLNKNISGLSRETVLDEAVPGIFSIYGGKFTTYRAVAQKIGGILSQRLKSGGQSLTHMEDSWFLPELQQEFPEIFLSSAELRKMA